MRKISVIIAGRHQTSICLEDEFYDELKKIALNCFDKNGNPNLSIALRIIDCKAKIAGLYNTAKDTQVNNVIKMNEIVPFAKTWMDLETLSQSEVSQKEKNKYHILTCMYGI